jgi:hypothetical protein
VNKERWERHAYDTTRKESAEEKMKVEDEMKPKMLQDL